MNHCLAVCICCLLLQLVYHGLQLVAFSLLAILIMRLKLFLTPHMCIMAALICSKQVTGLVCFCFISFFERINIVMHCYSHLSV